VFQDATGRDLAQFGRWYNRPAPPACGARGVGQWHLQPDVVADHPPTPGQPDKQPLHIPVAVGLLNPNGDEVLPTTVLHLTEAEQTFAFPGLAARPIPSVLRGFSAPVILDHPQDDTTRAFLLAHDTDPFNRWEAGRALAKDR
jgi:aminopeptidase N